MFLLFPYSLLFSFFLFLSTMMVISAPNWLSAWFAMELNLLSLIPLMMSSKSLQELESATKYFFAQSVGSILILLGAFYPMMETKYLIMTGLLLKLGIIPFHFWFPAAMSGMSWEMCMMMSTWQKLPLLCLLSFLLAPCFILFLLSGAMSALGGGLLGLNQTQLRALLAYSSISHTGWVIALMSTSSTASWAYFTLYSIINLTTMLILSRTSAIFFWSYMPFSFLLILLLLSLGGLPPLSGFATKLGAISLLSMISMPMTLCLILGSLLSLYYYLTLSFSLLLRTFISPMTMYLMTPPALPISLSLFTFTLIANMLMVLSALDLLH